MEDNDFGKYLEATGFIDSDNPTVLDYSQNAAGNAESDMEKAINIFYAVRDDIYYDPYNINLDPQLIKASYILNVRKGYCVTKALLLAACGRAIGIPSRLGYAAVKNHITTDKLREAMETGVFYYHGYTEFFLNGKWVKATPAFNLSLCEKFSIKPLEFDGKTDSLFHEYDAKGNRHMEYLHDYGHYADLPLTEIMETYREKYPPKLIEKLSEISGNFEDEAKPL